MLGEESSESKVILACLSGTIVSGAATLICWLIHRDPLGVLPQSTSGHMQRI